ncbi:class I SAM-dependent methyltransferase [Neptunicella marina]|uniref:Methyltransferase domain-containing protein n=1 Tax=Neptunicella marina TaxID=2125989 RepID=A0A8J6ISY7_9ALTE|nr:methyltransferase domain-containing protein [Neptunicella marina]MBC3765011.1 methyltransferase domain-containing protein [Neptunicella marina]
MAIRNILPSFIYTRLFGDRKQFGLDIQEQDSDWQAWLNFYNIFYTDTQSTGVGERVNHLGYKVLNNIDFKGKIVAEIGPGSLPHLAYWNAMPDSYYAIDVKKDFLENAQRLLPDICKQVLVKRDQKIPLAEHSLDILLTFYSLEHIRNLDDQLTHYFQLLKKDGILVGAIPNEGGIAWGLGRYLTTRRFVKNNADFNYDKIICWEHPNFADDILRSIKKCGFKLQLLQYKPLSFIPLTDTNLVTLFIATKQE